MSTFDKLLKKILSGTADKNLSIKYIKSLLKKLGFEEREGTGGHTIYKKPGIPEIINIQSTKDGKAKPYQVKQVRDIIIKYILN